MTTTPEANIHQECQTVRDLKQEIRSLKGNNWKILSAVLVIVFGFGGCSSSMAMYYTSRTGDKIQYQRQLIDQNKDAIHKGESQYQKLNGAISAIISGMKEQREEYREQREEQKTLVKAVHRIEVIVAKKSGQ